MNRKKKVSRKEIVDAIQRIAKKLKRPPRKPEFHAHSGISEHFLGCQFVTWNEALIAAGLPTYFRRPNGDEDLLADWGEMVRRLGPYHSKPRHDAEGKFSSFAISRRFGSWRDLPQVFRAFAGKRPEWKDVIEKMDAHDRRFSRMGTRACEGVGARRFECAETEGRPERAVRRGEGAGSIRTAIGDEARASQACGDPIDFGRLRTAPINESGVVLLFGMMAEELGFVIEAVQAGFPDCEARRRGSDGKWRRLRIEFEYESRNFLLHGHEPADCDVIVCWRNNWPECPLEVIELETKVRKAAA